MSFALSGLTPAGTMARRAKIDETISEAQSSIPSTEYREEQKPKQFTHATLLCDYNRDNLSDLSQQRIVLTCRSNTVRCCTTGRAALCATYCDCLNDCSVTVLPGSNLLLQHCATLSVVQNMGLYWSISVGRCQYYFFIFTVTP